MYKRQALARCANHPRCKAHPRLPAVRQRLLPRSRSLAGLSLIHISPFIRQITQGRGWFTTEFARYEILPEMLVPAVVEQAKKLGNLDEGAED